MSEFSNAVVAGMATFPQRAASLEGCIERIAPQVDALLLYLNEYNSVPHFLAKFRNVYPVLGKDAYGDLSATGKMVVLKHCRNCYLFLFDDDILVPADYVDKMKAGIDLYENRAAFCVHGTIIAGDAEGYFERSQYFGWREGVREHKLVTLVGSGTFAVHQSRFPANFEQFLGEVMVDLRISLICRDNGVPLLSIERRAFWLDINIQDGLWEQFRASVTHHTLAMRENRPWTFPRFAAIVTAMFEEQFGGLSREAARLRKFDSETTAAILGGWTPPGWEATSTALGARTRHLRSFGR